MSALLFDGEIEPDQTVEVMHEIVPGPIYGRRYAYFFNGGAESATMEIEWAIRPPVLDVFFTAEEEGLQNEDLTEGRVFHPELRGGEEARLSVTNDGNETTTLKVFAQPYNT